MRKETFTLVCKTLSVSPVDMLRLFSCKNENIGFNGYIDIWILRIYWRYIGGYFYMNINISKINKNILKFIKILSKSIKIILIIKYIH